MLGLSLVKAGVFLHLYLFVDCGSRGVDISRLCLSRSGVDSWLLEVSLGIPVDGTGSDVGGRHSRRPAKCGIQRRRASMQSGRTAKSLGRRIGDRRDTGMCQWVARMSERQEDTRPRMGVRRCGDAWRGVVG